MKEKYKLSDLVKIDLEGSEAAMLDPATEVQDIPYGELEDMDGQ